MSWTDARRGGGGGRRTPSHYKTAQICLNGHMITDNTENEERCSKFCRSCGVATITACQRCKADIRGEYHAEGVFSTRNAAVHSFCHECGEAYPWAAAKIKAARDMADELDELSAEEKERLKGTLNDLIRTTPQTEIAVVRFKKLLAKAGNAGANAMRDIVVDLASEAAKKLLLGI